MNDLPPVVNNDSFLRDNCPGGTTSTILLCLLDGMMDCVKSTKSTWRVQILLGLKITVKTRWDFIFIMQT